LNVALGTPLALDQVQGTGSPGQGHRVGVHGGGAALGTGLADSTGGDELIAPQDRTLCWAEPGTQHTYPLSYEAYRRAREAEEKPLPRHLGLGPAVDHHVWDRWRLAPMPEVEVLLTMRADAPPRIRRMAAEILRAIRRGRPAEEAIRHVSRRFGLRQARAQACLAACLGVELLPIQHDAVPSAASTPWPFSHPADWM